MESRKKKSGKRREKTKRQRGAKWLKRANKVSEIVLNPNVCFVSGRGMGFLGGKSGHNGKFFRKKCKKVVESGCKWSKGVIR